MTPEGRVKAKVKRELRALDLDGYKVYAFMPMQNGMGAPSLDFLCCINGYWVGIETKAPGKMMTDRQEFTANAMQNAGALVFVVSDDVTLASMLHTIRTCCRTHTLSAEAERTLRCL